MMVDSALQFAPHSYRLWLVAAAQQARWPDAAALLQRGVLALCRGRDGTGSHGALPEAQAAAALDLGLRLLALLGAAGQDDSRAALLAWAGADVGGSAAGGHGHGGGSLLLRSKAALLHELQQHPRLLCTLWLCCAHVAAHGRLPPAAEHSLGYQQPPLAELLRSWPAAPMPTYDAAGAAAAAACRAALLAAAGDLGLLAGDARQLQHERRLGQQHAEQLAAQRAAAWQAQPAAVTASRCAVALALLRLRGSAWHPAGTAAALLSQVAGCGGGQASTAALELTQRCWRAWSAQQREQQQHAQRQRQRSAAGHPAGDADALPAAELLLLLQEAVVADALAGAAPAAGMARHTPGTSSAALLAALKGRLHPAAVAALASAVAGCGHTQAASAAHALLSSWAVAYERGVSSCVRRERACMGPV